MSVLNLHEEERQKRENRIPIGWMPNYDLTNRPGQGYECDQARKFDCFMTAFATFCATGIIKPNKRRTLFGYQVRRQTRFFLGGLMGDQQIKAYPLNNSKYMGK